MKSMTLLCILTVVGISLTATPVQAKKPAAEVQQATKHQQQPPLLMDRAQIHALNTAISQKMGGPITDETAPMTAEKLKSELSRYQMKRALYHDGRLMTEKEKKELISCAYGRIPSVIPLRYGVTVKRTDLKSFPTGMRAYSAPTDRDFDVFQETAVDPAVPVLIYHEDATGRFLFVRAYFLPRLGAKRKRSRNRPRHMADVCRAQGKSRRHKLGPLHWEREKTQPFTKWEAPFPLKRAIFSFPCEIRQATLSSKKKKRVLMTPCTRGPSPTRKKTCLFLPGVISVRPMAGAAEKKASIARPSRRTSIGPWESSCRETAENRPARHRAFPFKGLSRKARLSLLKTLPVGSLLYMPGHIMIYSGEKNGIPMVIHALGIQGCQGKRAPFGKYLS